MHKFAEDGQSHTCESLPLRHNTTNCGCAHCLGLPALLLSNSCWTSAILPCNLSNGMLTEPAAGAQAHIDICP